MNKIKIFTLIYLSFFVSALLLAQSLSKNPPKLTEYVTDETGTLTSEQLRTLRLKLKAFDDSTSTQIVVLMINSLYGEPIEFVANSIFKYNKIGSEGKNNGVLLLISKGDRKIRIEVGYGLEGVLPDALAKRIIKNEIAPELKKDNYYDGIVNGINSIIKVTKGEYSREEDEEGMSLSTIVILSLFPAIIILIIIVSVIQSKRGGSGSYSGSGYSSSSYDSSSSDYSSSSSDSSGFSGGGGDSGGGGASGDY